jgi:hypothetical protein
MRLPNSDKAWIPPEKIVGYLLSTAHPVGSAKATFFRSFGFDDQNTDLLEAGLLHIAHTNEISDSTDSPFGTKYEVDGELETPHGRVVIVRTVWIIETGERNPRFVTAFPA